MQLSSITEALSKGILKKVATAMGRELNGSDYNWIDLDSIVRAGDVDDTRLPHGDWIAKRLLDFYNDSGFGDSEITFSQIDEQLYEHAGWIKQALADFVDAKQRLRNAGKSTNINDYRSVDELQDAITASKSVASKSAGGIKTKFQHLPGVQLIGKARNHSDQDDESITLDVYKVDDESSLKSLGEGTKWCTRGSYPNPRARYYLDRYEFMFLVFAGNRPIMQICSDLSEPMDRNNEEMKIPASVFEIIAPHAKMTISMFENMLQRIAESGMSSDNSNNAITKLVNDFADQYDRYTRGVHGLMPEALFKRSVSICQSIDLPIPEVLRTLAVHHMQVNALYDAIDTDDFQDLKVQERDKILAYLSDSDSDVLFDSENDDALSMFMLAVQDIDDKPSRLRLLSLLIKKAIKLNSQSESDIVGISISPGYIATGILGRLANFYDIDSPTIANIMLKHPAAAVQYFQRKRDYNAGVRWPELEQELIVSPLSYETINYASGMTDKWDAWINRINELLESFKNDVTMIELCINALIDHIKNIAKQAKSSDKEAWRRSLAELRLPVAEAFLLKYPYLTSNSYDASKNSLAVKYAEALNTKKWDRLVDTVKRLIKLHKDGLAPLPPTEASRRALVELISYFNAGIELPGDMPRSEYGDVPPGQEAWQG